MPPRRPMGVVLAAALGAVLLAAGCTGPSTRVAVSWPVAVSELAVPMPADLLRWPLTGKSAPSEAATHARIVSVKIENTSPARPQSGLNEADLVYETLTEGGITRFNALYQSNAPSTVGPVRSARLSDADIVPQYSALFAHAGGNTIVKATLAREKVLDLDYSIAPSAYRRDSARSAPHNLYTAVPALRSAGRRRGYPATQETRPFSFKPAASVAATQAVQEVVIPFSDYDRVTWGRSAANTWIRSDSGLVAAGARPAPDIRSENVIVLWVLVSPTAKRDVNGVPTLEIGLTGSGRAVLFRADGLRVNGTWSAERGAPPLLTDTEGAPMRLLPGRTWFEVLPSDANIRFR